MLLPDLAYFISVTSNTSRCGRAKAAGANDGDIRLADHYVMSSEVDGDQSKAIMRPNRGLILRIKWKSERCRLLARLGSGGTHGLCLLL